MDDIVVKSEINVYTLHLVSFFLLRVLIVKNVFIGVWSILRVCLTIVAKNNYNLKCIIPIIKMCVIYN